MKHARKTDNVYSVPFRIARRNDKVNSKSVFEKQGVRLLNGLNWPVGVELWTV
jgi:hypothetical protein